MNVLHINSRFRNELNSIQDTIVNFDRRGRLFFNNRRNIIKLFEIRGAEIVVKYFRKLTFANRIIYKFFRKSKARRSFEYAEVLLENNIGTPQPVAYFEHYSSFLLHDSFYISLRQDTDFTFRDLINTPLTPEHETILRQFVHFTHNLHEHKIEFRDHSAGNTLIKKKSPGQYQFSLVDLNRMRFNRSMSLQERIKNFSKLTTNKEILEIICSEYAGLQGISYTETLNRLLYFIARNEKRSLQKKRFKKIIKFWKWFPGNGFILNILYLTDCI